MRDFTPEKDLQILLIGRRMIGQRCVNAPLAGLKRSGNAGLVAPRA